MNNSNNNGNTTKTEQSLRVLALATLGVVFGDIGTSPLYAIRECFFGEYAIAVTHDNILGILSLMFWALTFIVSLKYLTFVLRADNRGEGGVIALTALIRGEHNKFKRSRYILIIAGVFGASLLYGDGIITPAISVLSAAEGLRIITPEFEPYVIPATLIILAGLFLLQHRGTARVGALFGPVIFIWFTVLAILGFRQILGHPQIFAALSPWYGLKFILNNGFHGFTVLGAVFLVVTGAEALYADMGHFGKKPIRLVWFVLVLPALVINYFGQGALLLAKPEMAHHPFYATVPQWAVIPVVILATMATIIASQAVITGVFSLTRQAVQLGYLPRLKITHTSSKHLGQIYVPQVNWLMMIATLSLVLGFQSSSKLAAAYGVAVTSTMLISTILFYVVAREKWNWSRLSAGIPVAIFLMVDLSFFSANLSKILHGAWFPLAIGFSIMFIMLTWKRGREILYGQFQQMSVKLANFKSELAIDEAVRVKGNAIFMSGQVDSVPVALAHNLKHNKVIHNQVGFLHFLSTEDPRVPNIEKVKTEKLGSGFYNIVASYGYMESPSVPKIIALMHGQGVEFPIDETSFFLGREKLIWDKDHYFSRWRAHLFAFLSRNAYDASSYYEIPQEQVIEVGVRLKI
ncbi:MAG: potassium transporter Kup [Candidatus Zixiibacteriota bacterium]